MKINILLLLLITACLSCSKKTDSKTEKYHQNRDFIVNIQDQVKEIVIEDVFISNISWLNLIDDYLIVADYHSDDKLIHLFDKNNFNYITSTTSRGLGPGEIANVGRIAINEGKRTFHVLDHGKQKVFSFQLDSILINPDYKPEETTSIDKTQFPVDFQILNDTFAIALVFQPIGNADYKPVVAKWNMINGEIIPMKYSHSEIEKKRINSAASIENDIYVECYWHHDLMTICSLNGELKYNVYGPKWNNEKTNRVSYYRDVIFVNDKILVLYYDGNDTFYSKTKANYPTKFILFDIEGNYLKTLETGYKITSICFDKENNRIIMLLDDEIQFAYFSIDGIA